MSKGNAKNMPFSYSQRPQILKLFSVKKTNCCIELAGLVFRQILLMGNYRDCKSKCLEKW